jgi:thiamine biosynthesis lipoprotein
MLEIQGIMDYMVEIGGELRLKGKNIAGDKWRIAIEKPSPELRAIHKVLPITDISIATSGDYRNYFEIDGVRFSHTIDPRNGRPITHNLASVTILSESAMQADALATALMVLGPDQGFGLAQQEKIAAFFIIKSKDGFEEKKTSAYTEKTR